MRDVVNLVGGWITVSVLHQAHDRDELGANPFLLGFLNSPPFVQILVQIHNVQVVQPLEITTLLHGGASGFHAPEP